jgi:lipopolysaccharide export system permease protein
LPPNPYTRAELQYRMSAPIMCLVLMLLAIPLGFVNPRAGASTNLILALLIFFTYLNLTKAAEKAVEQGRLAFAMGWWPLHLLLLLVALVLFAWRMNVNHRLHPMVVLNALRRRHLLQSASAKGGAK